MLLNRLSEIENRYNELEQKLSDPQIVSDLKKYRECTKAHAELAELVDKIRQHRSILANIEVAHDMLRENHDLETEHYLQEELNSFHKQRDKLENQLKQMLIPKDPNDEKDIIMEIRAGAGGQEASLFAADLYKMYLRFTEKQKWVTQVMSSSPSDLGGFKEIIFEVKGRRAYSRLKYESGVHRVQRIPATEAGGRIHTSTATVAVLPEVEEVEVEIDPSDLRIDVFRSSGPGGQSVNTTDSAVRISHLPSGIVAQCQEERSQLQNRDRALKILRARLYERFLGEQRAEVAQARKLQIGTGDRSERIRTYNFPQGRVTDHRIGLTLHKLDAILQGDLDEVIESLATADRAEKLKEVV